MNGVLAGVLGFLGNLSVAAETWPQAAGPNANWKVEGQAATHWSVVQNMNIKWRTTLPGGGQSSVTIWEDKAFLTTHHPLNSSAETATATDIVGYCLDAATGKILWTIDLPGSVAVGTAGIFRDATVFAPISDGKHVSFFNRSGAIASYDMDRNRVWLHEYTPRTRHTNRECEPILINDQLLVVEVLDKEAAKKLQRHQPVPFEVNPKSFWTYPHAIDAQTGKVLWVEPAGTVVHNTPMVGRRIDGEWAVLHLNAIKRNASQKRPMQECVDEELFGIASNVPGQFPFGIFLCTKSGKRNLDYAAASGDDSAAPCISANHSLQILLLNQT